ncbi:unnamed protein product [Tilletia controversa]|uniref:SGT1-domain-containing protein n=1 Tax=Tilletia controversa TaxID=13291 RepID=A0A8X7ML31_9BASI|nr:hypothetical protein CF328_g7203 [Tilletia controversa]KAE8240324.1 hypothetical protein A4X06_0g7814 [Tilletia controversa]CAD6905063.1 unnamed protein product [Tilletia controversa]CAD6928731.1 unnamed protein product [Tilletia controversa]
MEGLRAGPAAELAPELIVHLYPLPSHHSTSDHTASLAIAIAIALQSFLQSQSHQHLWHSGHPPTINTPSTSASTPAEPQPALTLTLPIPSTAPDTDEWYALHLLITFLTLPEQQQKQQYAVQATDSDGDFLLIQGADHLPHWIEPTNATNRVWILPSSSPSPSGYRNASLHLIGPDLAPLPPEHSSEAHHQLAISDALQIVATEATKPEREQRSRAPQPLQIAALEPMIEFLSPSYSNIHRTLAYLPHHGIAALLQNEPLLCAQAIGALEGLSTDQLDRRVISRMAHFGPMLSSPPVLAPVPLTKALYALSIHLVLFPPKPHFSPEWREAVATFRTAQQQEQHGREEEQGHQQDQAVGGKITEIDEEAEQRKHEDVERRERVLAEGRWRDIGSKLICGLELLHARGRTELGSGTTQSSEQPDAILADPASNTLKDLLALESSTDWLTELVEGPPPGGERDSGAETQDDDDDGEDGGDALRRLQDLMQGTSDFIEKGQGDYRGATFDDDDVDLSDEDADDDDGEGDEEKGKGEGDEQENDAEGEKENDDEEEEDEEGMAAFLDGPGIGPAGQKGQGFEDDEMVNFLAFARNELGIDDELWNRIQADRRRDGRYLPPATSASASMPSSSGVAGGKQGAKKETSTTTDRTTGSGLGKQVRFDGLPRGFLNKKAKQGSEGSDKGKGKDKEPAAANDGDRFYTLMDQMDAELAKVKDKGKSPTPAPATKTQSTAERMDLDDLEDEDDDDDGDEDDDDDDELDLQDAELLRKLLSAQGDSSRTGGGSTNGVPSSDMLANFLESFKAQGSGPGPVSNLAGRLGVGKLPRDDD